MQVVKYDLVPGQTVLSNIFDVIRTASIRDEKIQELWLDHTEGLGLLAVCREALGISDEDSTRFLAGMHPLYIMSIPIYVHTGDSHARR